jgi:hypothetical protein
MDLYLDAEWFIGGDVFLIGYAYDKHSFGSLHDESLTLDNFNKLLKKVTGKIYIYGPDVGVLEKYFDIDIRTNYHCVNLLKVFRDHLPGLKSYKLANIEKLYGIKRNRNEYKANIFSIFQDWRRPQVKSLVLQYNQEDVINLVKLKNVIFAQKDVEEEYLLQARLAGALEIIQNHVYLLPCDIYRGASYGKFKSPLSTSGEGKGEGANITARMVVGAKFFEDKVSRYRMAVLMHNIVKDMKFDIVTSVNGRDSKFDLAAFLGRSIARRLGIEYRELLSNGNKTCSPDVLNRTVLVIDDVIYKGTTMKKTIEACSKQKPLKIYFLAFGKSMRFAY